MKTYYIVKAMTARNGEQRLNFDKYEDALELMKKLENQMNIVSASIVKHVEEETTMLRMGI